MAHEIYEMEDGRQSMGFVGETPWHGLGQKITEDAPLETWAKEAGLDWEIQRAPVQYTVDGLQKSAPGRDVLFRSDNQEPLSVVSSIYKIVQPAEILEFYRELIEVAGFKMHTAGSLFKGRRLWALAKVGDEFNFGPDKVESYLLLATSCDGSLATTAQFTSVRVVCNNTLSFSIQRGDQGQERRVRVPHSTHFNVNAVKAEMGLIHDSFQLFAEQSMALTKVRLSNKDAVDFLIRVMGEENKPLEEQKSAKQMARIIQLYKTGPGANLPSADGTAWGLVNAVTRYVDHDRNTKSNDARLNAAWFGKFEKLKTKAFSDALELAA